MTRNEAIILLTWCGFLATKLGAFGIDIELNKEDQVTLKGFSKVWVSGWLNDPNIYREARLSRSDIETLTLKMSQDLTEGRQRKHITGEQID